MLSEMTARACQWLADTILAYGYPGVFFLMAIESSFIPFPSEIVMIPAGFHIHQGDMRWAPTLAAGALGSLAGAWINYGLALKLGRPFFLRYGKYLLAPPEKLERAEAFFLRHGEFATFTARLLPVIRQLLSLPAGMARMNFFRFSLYTAAGAGIWVAVLTVIGYWVGANKDLAAVYLQAAVYAMIELALLALLWRIRTARRMKTP